MADEIQPKLVKLYSTVPNSASILEGVQRGRREYLIKLKEYGLLQKHTSHISTVHAYDDVEVQAFILAIPSDGNLEEMSVKSLLTYGSHFIDDFLDRPDLEPGLDTLSRHRRNIKELLDSIGDVGKFAHFLAQKTRHPDGVYRGLQLMAYAALIHLARTKKEQETYLEEHKQFNLAEASEELRTDIISMSNVAHWLSTKTAQEIWFGVEPKYNSNLALLWNLIYSPALYLHDAHEEKQKGELNFYGNKLPTLDEMIFMIDVAAKHIKMHQDDRLEQRLLQLRFLRKAFEPVLPRKILESYDGLERQISLF